MASTIYQENGSCCEYSHATSFIQTLLQTTSAAALQMSYGLENNDTLKLHKQPLNKSTMLFLDGLWTIVDDT